VPGFVNLVRSPGIDSRPGRGQTEEINSKERKKPGSGHAEPLNSRERKETRTADVKSMDKEKTGRSL
jgi:hypothetical protein